MPAEKPTAPALSAPINGPPWPPCRQGCLASWCQRLDHPADGCLYLAVAESQQAPLITADQRLLDLLQGYGAPAELAVHLQQWHPPNR